MFVNFSRSNSRSDQDISDKYSTTAKVLTKVKTFNSFNPIKIIICENKYFFHLLIIDQAHLSAFPTAKKKKGLINLSHASYDFFYIANNVNRELLI